MTRKFSDVSGTNERPTQHDQIFPETLDWTNFGALNLENICHFLFNNLVTHKHVKNSNRNRRFGVYMTPKAKFTMEVKKNGMLPFLGTQLLNCAPKWKPSFMWKPTNTGLLLNYQSHVGNRYKRSLSTTMLDRADRLSSSWTHFSDECDRLNSRREKATDYETMRCYFLFYRRKPFVNKFQ